MKITVTAFLFLLSVPSWATTPFIVDAASLVSYDYFAKPMDAATIARCPGWTISGNKYNSPGGLSYFSANVTALTLTIQGHAAGTYSFPTVCDGDSPGPDGLLASADEELMGSQLGELTTESCHMQPSCGPNGQPPCTTVFGTQSGTWRLLAQADANGVIFDWHSDVLWGSCQ